MSMQLANGPGTALQVSGTTSVQIARAVEIERAKMLFAMTYPRVESECLKEIEIMCKDAEFAEDAMYGYKRGNTQISGVEVHHIVAIADKWKHIGHGWSVLDVRPETDSQPAASLVHTFALDYSTLHGVERDVWIAHERRENEWNKGVKTPKLERLFDDRDVREHIANIAQRAMRVCIEELLGPVVKAKAEGWIRDTQRAVDKKQPVADVIKKAVEVLAKYGVTQADIENWAKCTLDKISEKQIQALRDINTALKSGEVTKGDVFPTGVSATNFDTGEVVGKPGATDSTDAVTVQTNTTDSQADQQSSTAQSGAPATTRRTRGPNKPKPQSGSEAGQPAASAGQGTQSGTSAGATSTTAGTTPTDQTSAGRGTTPDPKSGAGSANPTGSLQASGQSSAPPSLVPPPEVDQGAEPLDFNFK